MFTKLCKDLERALRTLDAEQGRIARRNARRRVRHAMRRITSLVDEAYPLIRQETKARRKKRTPSQRIKKLAEEGWVQVRTWNASGMALLTLAAELKLPVKTINANEGESGGTFVPGWVAHFAGNKQQLFLARKNVTMIQAANAAVRLGSLANDERVVCPKR